MLIFRKAEIIFELRINLSWCILSVSNFGDMLLVKINNTLIQIRKGSGLKKNLPNPHNIIEGVTTDTI